MIEARAMGWGGNVDAARLADLMDAVHNIPHLLNDWEHCDQDLLRGMLRAYQKKWAAKGGYRLARIYDDIVAGRRPGS
ncbi:MAG TPA: hypothetical protein VFB66_24685 [Tepidisphaeraceae bacterium]|nr:hypothetical protein [Tepidisphaeraceae bacterium]